MRGREEAGVFDVTVNGHRVAQVNVFATFPEGADEVEDAPNRLMVDVIDKDERFPRRSVLG